MKILFCAGLLKEGKIENATQLGSCKCTTILPFVACIVKQCKPNGLGDMQISIKVNVQNTHLVFLVQNIVQIIFQLKPTIGYQCDGVGKCP